MAHQLKLSLLVALAATVWCLAPAAAQAQRLRGIVTGLSGDTLYVKADDGGLHEVDLGGTKIFAMVPATLADVKPDAFVGVLSMPEKDSLRAVAINIFPAAARGLNEGKGPWDTAPDSVMTNGFVTTTVEGVAGQTLKLKYKGTEGEVMVTPATQIVTMAPSDLRELSPGVHVLVFTAKRPDGGLKAGALIAGHGGLVPPL
jgi:hypothetical protein